MPRVFKYPTEAERLAARTEAKVRYNKRKTEETRNSPHCGQTEDAYRHEPPPELMADALRIRYMTHPLIVGELMGDPMPGRSALDRQRNSPAVIRPASEPPQGG